MAQGGSRGGLFNFSRSPTAPPSRPEVPSTDIIDEFAGLSFSALLGSYLQEPTETPRSPADALKRTPEGRLEDAITTATELLERVYSAYRTRTTLLHDALAEVSVQQEDIANERLRSANLRSQLDRLATEERDAREEQSQRIQEQQQKVRELEAELSREHKNREVAEVELHIPGPRRRSKRRSAASDSGFESDGDSLLSARTSIVVTPSEERLDGETASIDSGITSIAETEADACHSCCHKRSAVRTETRAPASLREPRIAGAPSTSTNKAGVWGFFKARQQQSQSTWGDIDSVRMENRWLKERVREMESAVDGALEAVAGRGI